MEKKIKGWKSRRWTSTAILTLGLIVYPMAAMTVMADDPNLQLLKPHSM